MVGIVFKQIRTPWTVAAMNCARGEGRWVGLSVASGLLTASWVRSCLRRASCSPPVSTPHEPQKARLCPGHPQCDRASLGSSHDPWIWGFHARSIAQSKLVRLRLTAVSSGPRRAASPGEAAALPSGRPSGEAPLAQAGGCSGPGPWGTPPCRRAWCGCASARGSGLRVQVAVRPLPGHTPRVWPDTREPGRRGVRRASERALSPGTTCQSPGSCHAPQGLQGASGKTGRPPPVCRRLSRAGQLSS